MNGEDIEVKEKDTLNNSSNRVIKEEDYSYDNHDSGELLKAVVFNTFKIKYEDLNEKMEALNVILEKPVSLYINFTSIMEKFYNKNIIENDPIYKENYMNLTVYILNLVLHYRRYLFSRKDQENKIYILYKGPKEEVQPEFSLLTSCIDTNMKLIKDLCPYIPGVYFIDSTSYPNECSIIEYLMLEDYDTEIGEYQRFHWILSRDITDIQSLGITNSSTRDVLITILKYDIQRRINSSVFLYKGHIFDGLARIYGSKATDLKDSLLTLDNIENSVTILPIVQFFATNKMLPIRKSFRKIVSTIVANLGRIYIGNVNKITESDLFKALYTKKEIESMRDVIETGALDNLYLLYWIKFHVLLFNKADETFIESCIYDLKNRSLEEINQLPYITPTLFVDIETLIQGGDINGNNIRKPKRIQW